MVRILDRSATYDAVLATWRRPDDLYAVPPVEPWAPDTGCDCDSGGETGCGCEDEGGGAREPDRASGRAMIGGRSANRDRGLPSQRSTTGASAAKARRSAERPSPESSRRAPTAAPSAPRWGPQRPTAAVAARSLREGTIPTDPPCVPDVSSPPPYDKFTEPDAWLAWWGDCPPSGALGPGADDCDLEQAWWDALEFCCDELRAYAERNLSMRMRQSWCEFSDYPG